MWPKWWGSFSVAPILLRCVQNCCSVSASPLKMALQHFDSSGFRLLTEKKGRFPGPTLTEPTYQFSAEELVLVQIAQCCDFNKMSILVGKGVALEKQEHRKRGVLRAGCMPTGSWPGSGPPKTGYMCTTSPKCAVYSLKRQAVITIVK